MPQADLENQPSNQGHDDDELARGVAGWSLFHVGTPDTPYAAAAD